MGSDSDFGLSCKMSSYINYSRLNYFQTSAHFSQRYWFILKIAFLKVISSYRSFHFNQDYNSLSVLSFETEIAHLSDFAAARA